VVRVTVFGWQSVAVTVSCVSQQSQCCVNAGYMFSVCPPESILCLPSSAFMSAPLLPDIKICMSYIHVYTYVCNSFCMCVCACVSMYLNVLSFVDQISTWQAICICFTFAKRSDPYDSRQSSSVEFQRHAPKPKTKGLN